ncbi:MAG: hypothetical protein HKO70_00650 [Acidimicrobiia bacterium]|nr:hypothetical protein [Acidimicrobiia bacterium]
MAITVGAATTAVVQNPWTTLSIISAENTLPGMAGLVIDTAFAASSLGALLAAISLVVRYRGSTGVTRSQIRWIAVGGSTFIAALVIVPNFETADDTGALGAALGVAAFLLLTVSYAIAIAKYRLYEIDVVISKSMTYLGLAGVITALYAVIVVGPVLLIGRSDDGGPGLVLPIVATAVVAVLFEPIRIRLQRQANLLVYGERSTPQEVLSQVTARFTDDSAGTAPDDLAQLLAEGTGAKQAVVWLRIGDTLQPEGIWQADRDAALVEPVPTDGLVDDQFTAWRPVQHNEHLFGALSVTKPRNDAITPTDAALLADVAAGAGLLLRNISLNRQLEARARELRESRRRLIAAQDAERHRLERDLHDGAQQQVVALKVKLGIAKTVAEREGAADVAAHITALADDTQQAVDALRSVAHGIYPPLLESEGLEAALRAVERSGDQKLMVETSRLIRYSRGIEAAVYFLVTDIAERARRAGASFTRATITGEHGLIVIDLVTDATIAGADLRLVTDRIETLGGTTRLETSPDGINRFIGRVPATEHELEPA